MKSKLKQKAKKFFTEEKMAPPKELGGMKHYQVVSFDKKPRRIDDILTTIQGFS